MDIGALCQRQIVTVDAGGPLVDAARLMREQLVGALIVTSAAVDGPSVIGIVTDRDLLIDALARCLDTQGGAIGGLASPGVASAFEGDPLSTTRSRPCKARACDACLWSMPSAAGRGSSGSTI